jgi:hypothetical protein
MASLVMHHTTVLLNCRAMFVHMARCLRDAKRRCKICRYIKGILTCGRYSFYRLSRFVLARVTGGTCPPLCGAGHPFRLGCNGQSRSGIEGHSQTWSTKNLWGVDMIWVEGTCLSASNKSNEDNHNSLLRRYPRHLFFHMLMLWYGFCVLWNG